MTSRLIRHDGRSFQCGISTASIISHFWFVTLSRSVAFYTDILGFTPIERSGSANVAWLTIGGLDTIHLIEGDFGATHLTKDTHFALRIDDLDAFVTDIAAKGVTFYDWPGNIGKIGVRRDGFRQAYLQDPDGYWIEINDHTRAVAE